MLARRTWLAGVASWGLAACTSAPLRPWQSAPSARLPGARQWDMHDRISGHTWRVWLQPPAPEAPAPAHGHPVLWVLDGNASFALVAQLARNDAARPADMRTDTAIVVGIGHPGDAAYHPAARQRDYTPPQPEGTATAQAGGANLLLDFLAHTLQPQLAQSFNVDPQRQTLTGHSFGGLLVLHALLTRPAQFTRYAAASPSVWWNQGQILQTADRFARTHITAPRPFHAQLQLRLGGLEHPATAATAQRRAVQQERRMQERTHALATQLTALQWPELEVQMTVLPGLDHGAVMAPALIDALALAQQPRTPSP